MKLLSQISDLKAVSGGYSYSYDEFVTEDIIFYNSVLSSVSCSISGGVIGGVLGLFGGIPGAVAFGTLGAAGGAYLGYKYNDYSDIEPNTLVHWTVNVVYY